LQEIIQSALQQDIYEWSGLITGVLYVLLAAKEKVACWIFGIISCGCIAFKDLTDYHLFADAGLQIFYMVMGVIGLYQWISLQSSRSKEPAIKTLPLQKNGLIILMGLLVSIPFGYILNNYTDAAFSYLDSITTIFSIIATLLLINKYLDNWVYWIFIDITYVYLYISRGGLLFAFLMLIYTIIAGYGFYQWRIKWKNIAVD
jgi:nicotinamide mononucleotide transporter